MTPADLVEIELIKRLKYRYMRCLDQKLWDEMAETLTDDLVRDVFGVDPAIVRLDRVASG